MANDPLTTEPESDEDQISDLSSDPTKAPSDADNDVPEDVLKDPSWRQRPPNQSIPTNPRPTGPGQTREPDPEPSLRRQVEPNRLAGGRSAPEIEQPSEPLSKAQPTQGLGKGPAPRTGGQLPGTRDLKEGLGKEAGNAVQNAGKSAAQAGAKIAKQAVKAAGKAVFAAIRAAVSAIVAYLGPEIAVAVAVFAVIGIGVAIIYNKEPSDVVTIDMNKPGMVDAVDRLASLAGDPAALSRQIAAKTADITQTIDRARLDVANAPLKTEINAELDNAGALLQRVRAGGTSVSAASQTQLINAMIYSMLRVSALFRGVAIQTGDALAKNAGDEVGRAGDWVYSENERPSDATKPMRDGTNTVAGKRGCNSSGFVVYLLRGDNTRCKQCITPTLDKIGATFSILRTTNVSSSSNDIDYKRGDILAVKVPGKTALEGYVVTNAPAKATPEQITVAYCSVNGPTAASLKQALDGRRTLLFQSRFMTEERAAASTGTGGSS